MSSLWRSIATGRRMEEWRYTVSIIWRYVISFKFCSSQP